MERDGWHARARLYDALAGVLTRDAIDPLLNVINVQSGMSLLDVCCGPGYGAGAAKERGLAAIGVDIAPAMLDEARVRFPDVEFRHGDAEQLEFADSSFDAVICSFGLLHLPEPDRALSAAFRVLKPGARYGATVWCGSEKNVFLGLSMKATVAHGDMNVPLPSAPPMFQFGDVAFATDALQKAGFRYITIEELPIFYQSDSPQEVSRWFERIAVRGMAVYRLQTPEVQRRCDNRRGAALLHEWQCRDSVYRDGVRGDHASLERLLAPDWQGQFWGHGPALMEAKANNR
jgi:ubiquinone/menaquinone biosynthesis C-methylase UbiE